MSYDRRIVEVIEEFSPLKLDSLFSIAFQMGEGEWPITATLQFLYDERWMIQMQFVQVRMARIPVIGGGQMDLGEPAICKSLSGAYKGLWQFSDELKGYYIVAGEILTTEVRQLA